MLFIVHKKQNLIYASLCTLFIISPDFLVFNYTVASVVNFSWLRNEVCEANPFQGYSVAKESEHHGQIGIVEMDHSSTAG